MRHQSRNCLIVMVAFALLTPQCHSFTPAKILSPHSLKRRHHHHSPILSMANQFDVSRPVFDPLSLRTIRGDAVVRYDALNQSEPLRIILYAVVALTLFAAPSLSEAVGYDNMNIPTTIGSYGVGSSSVALLLRECGRRSRQLTRIEKELNTESLPIRLPTNPLSDAPFSRPTILKELRTLSNPPRILAMSGTKEKLEEALQGLAVVGRRLKQATVYVIAVPTDGSKVSDLAIPSSSFSTSLWLADAYDPMVWQDYFQSLTADRDDATTKKSPSFQWFGLTSTGRSFGSGEEEVPLWLQVLGKHLRPTEFLDEEDTVSSTTTTTTTDPSLSESLNSFYDSLTNGNVQEMQSLFSSNETPQVSEVISAGGRVDSWSDCLAEGARPEGMKVSGADSVILSETEAYTTVIEFPSNAGIDSATLLAIQQWSRNSTNDSWKLQLHQTIPWSQDAKAQGTLRCDCRGCVALTRGVERRTFGGIIG